MLTLQNVRVTISVAAVPSALNSLAEDCGPGVVSAAELPTLDARLAQRDWRKLRQRLIGLDLTLSDVDNGQVVDWLRDAGYTPVVHDPPTMREFHARTWTPERVTQDILSWLSTTKT